MESLSTASEILSKLNKLTEGMALMRQDVDALKRVSLHQPNTSEEVVDSREVDETTDESAPLPAHPPTSSGQSSSWADEMDLRDQLLDDDDPTKDAATIKVVPVTERMNKFLNEALFMKMAGAERLKLWSKYTLPQNELTRAPFLDAVMASECSKSCKSTDRSLYTLQGLILEAIGPLSQLLEAVNDPNPQVSMDQVGEAVETANSLLANALP